MSKIIELKTTGMAHGTSAVGRIEGRVVFIDGAAPDETVKARILRKKKRFIEACLDEVVDPSPDRVESRCPLFDRCGGCHWQHVAYERQVSEKGKFVAEALSRIGKIENPQVETVPSLHAFGGRIKSRLHLSSNGQLGFFARRSHDLVDVEKCPLLVDSLNAALSQLRKALPDEDLGEGEVSLGFSPADDRAAVSFSLRMPPRPGFAGRIMRAVDKLQGVVVQVGKQRFEFGNVYLCPAMASDIYAVPHAIDSFWQSNPQLNEVAKERIAREITLLNEKLGRKANVLELFSGSGNLCNSLLDVAGRMTLVESDEVACKVAGQTMADNDGRIDILRKPVESGLKSCIKQGKKIDALILDPPRTGFDGLVDAVDSLCPESLLYLSCHPATLARDINPLIRLGYEMKSCAMIDFFPQTFHTETLVIMGRK